MDIESSRASRLRPRRASLAPAASPARREDQDVSLPPFEQVVREHGETVLRVCTAVVGRSAAEDVWSETFLAALAAYPRLRPESNVRAWILTIARNKAIDLHRTSSRSALPLEALPEPAATADADESELHPTLSAALATLPAKQRGAIAYHYVAELPYAQVAELLGTSEAAARRSAADGIASLRKRLTKEDRR
jgi:RNA polymerase sigma factor (sigma-70 family)